MTRPTIPAMPLLPIPVREVLALHPGITARNAAGLLGWQEKTTAARLGKFATYGVIDRTKIPNNGHKAQYAYRLKDEANA